MRGTSFFFHTVTGGLFEDQDELADWTEPVPNREAILGARHGRKVGAPEPGRRHRGRRLPRPGAPLSGGGELCRQRSPGGREEGPPLAAGGRPGVLPADATAAPREAPAQEAPRGGAPSAGDLLAAGEGGPWGREAAGHRALHPAHAPRRARGRRRGGRAGLR
ncbi:unnamed protein product, partial [Prorocentrum cordatum]